MTSRDFVKSVIPLGVRQTYWAYRELWSGEPEYKLLKFLCRQNRVSLDIGANRGMYSYWLIKYSASVIAFEPSPNFCERLRKAFPVGLEIRQCAVSAASSGSAVFRVPVIDGGMEYGISTMEVANDLNGFAVKEVIIEKCALDDLTLANVGFIKIDVEGHELSVLDGARKLLRKERPRLLIEAEERHRPDAVSSIRNFLQEYGFRGFYLADGRLHDIASFNQEEMQDFSNFSSSRGVQGKNYINNFIFTPLDDLDWIPKNLLRK
jgi:FkbM family methyltransferase